MDGISIHAPREGGDSVAVGGGECCGISIHAPREGGDSRPRSSASCMSDFNPRPPRGGRLGLFRDFPQFNRFQSTPPARGATIHFCRFTKLILISIHAPREGGDCCHDH